MKMFPAKVVQKAKQAYQDAGVADARTGGSIRTYEPGFKKSKNHEAHTSPMKTGMGSYYGTGFKAPVGQMRSDSVGYRPVSKNQLGTPPKSVV